MTTFDLSKLHELPQKKGLYGVLGDPVAHSLSPQIHNPAFQDLKIDAEYLRVHLKAEDLAEGVQKLQEHGFLGWNCTVPHKESMAKLCHRLDSTADRFQAVNTVRIEEGKRIGFNTDGLGWVRAIREEFQVDVSELRVMILGIGGAGRALAIQAALENCGSLTLVNRTPEKAMGLKKEIDGMLKQGRAWRESVPVSVVTLEKEALQKEISNVDLIVNCTSAGLNPESESLIDASLFQADLLVYDTIYKPAQTALLKEAQKGGARTANGLSMLLHQAALAFEIWTGRTAPLDLMRENLQEAAYPNKN